MIAPFDHENYKKVGREHKIVVRLTDGLGNQMFQYAAGRSLSIRLGARLAIDLKWYDEDCFGATPRRYGLEAFPIAAEVVLASDLELVKQAQQKLAPRVRRRIGCMFPRWTCPQGFVSEPFFHYWPGFERIRAPAYLSGFWQSPRYFNHIAERLITDFSFPPLPSVQARQIADAMGRAACPVAVHVRRGDYISGLVVAKIHGGCCPPRYYGEAIDLVAAKSGPLDLFIFSDDPAWVRGQFDTRGHRATVVEVVEHRDAPHHDLHLISLARHHIIANSSFSWWGAWLAAASQKIVIAPKKWFSGGVTDQAIADRLPPTWIAI